MKRDPTSHIRTQWISLSIEEFDPVGAGLLSELPWPDSSESRLVIGCTVVSSWSQGTLVKASSSDYWAWYTSDDAISYHRDIRTDLGPTDPEASKFGRHIELRPEWLEPLTPKAPDSPPATDGWRPTTLESMFYAAGFDGLMEELRTLPRYIGINGSCAIRMLDPTLTDMELWDAALCDHSDKGEFIEMLVCRLVSDGLSRRLSSRAFHMLSVASLQRG